MAEKVVVQLVLDTSRYNKGATSAARSTAKIQTAADKTSKSVSGLGSTALKAGAALGAAFAAKAALDFAKSSIAAFSNLEESINAVEVSFGDASEGVLALGENSATQFGLSTRAVNDAAVAMSAFAEKIDEADPADAFENVLQRATDFASVMNLDVEEALLIFRSGLAGESEPLRKFGIDVSAATVNLVGLEAGLGGTNGKLSEGEKIQARYLAIMEQTEKTAGDFANTSEGLANRQRILNAEWEEAQAQIGKALEPAMLALLEAATELVPVITKVAIVVGDLISEMAPLIGILADLILVTGDYSDETEEAAEGTESWLKALLRWKPFGDAIVSTTDRAAAASAALANIHEGLAARQDRLSEATARTNSIVGLGTSAPGRYNDVLSATARRAKEVATASQEQAKGIRAALAAQAEAASPALRLLRTQQRLVASQEKLVEVQEDGEASAADLTNAELDLVGAQIDLDSAAANLAGRVDESAAAFIRTAVQAGLLKDEALLLAQSLGLIPTTIDVNLRLNLGGLTTSQAANILAGSGAQAFRRHGGPVAADEPFIVGESGPELFIPDQAGRIIPNKGFGGQSIVVNVNDPTTTDLAADLSAGLIAAQITQQVETLRT